MLGSSIRARGDRVCSFQPRAFISARNSNSSISSRCTSRRSAFISPPEPQETSRVSQGSGKSTLSPNPAARYSPATSRRGGSSGPGTFSAPLPLKRLTIGRTTGPAALPNTLATPRPNASSACQGTVMPSPSSSTPVSMPRTTFGRAEDGTIFPRVSASFGALALSPTPVFASPKGAAASTASRLSPRYPHPAWAASSYAAKTASTSSPSPWKSCFPPARSAPGISPGSGG